MKHRLFSYAKPTFAFMDGITMGVGIALLCRFRVAAQNTKLAMPETGIGLFSDVVAGCYLSRLPRRIGQYLALTGARIEGAEALAPADHDYQGGFAAALMLKDLRLAMQAAGRPAPPHRGQQGGGIIRAVGQRGQRWTRLLRDHPHAVEARGGSTPPLASASVRGE